ncbi:MAG TPA: hypothetical protein VMV10_23645 [Pirellulales bacterium]|nr:hypothetical protein [Pirellulales bacterium]
MNVTSATVIVDYRLVSGFEAERQKLLAPEYSDRLSKPLAHWALPTDRHLPLALVGRTIESLIHTPFNELYATPGVGPKKIASLIRLLARAIQNAPAAANPIVNRSDEPAHVGNGRPHPALVSEAAWVQWRTSIRRHGLERETLGRLARSLQKLPRAIWNTQLGHYLDLTLEQIRGLRGHGEKRVSAVLEIFENLYQILLQVDANPHLAVQFRPRLVQQLESSIVRLLSLSGAPSADEVRTQFVDPLLELSRLDGGDLLAEVAAGRLSHFSTVQALARQKGLTRGRIYELWGDAAAIVNIRWPEGQALVSQLQAKLAANPLEPRVQGLFDAALELWFPLSPQAESAPVQSSASRRIAPGRRAPVRLSYSAAFHANGLTAPSEST